MHLFRSVTPLFREAVATLAPFPVLDFWAAQWDPTWSTTRALARVVEREHAAVDAVTLVLRPNRNWGGFRPGQHANIGVEIDGRRVTRSYSLSQVEDRADCVSITVKRVPDGKLSSHLCREAKVGDVLDIGPAFGDMVLPDVALGSYLFLAAGSGITPLMALTREIADRGPTAPVTLLYWSARREQLAFVRDLRDIAARHPLFEVRFLLTRESALARDEREGRLTAGTLAGITDLTSRQVFACGPSGFVESARALVAGKCRSFAAEAFTPAVASRDEGGTVQVTLAKTGRTLSVPRGRSLLTALEDQGFAPASGCRMGLCNTCACGKQSGVTRNLQTGAIEAEPGATIRLCTTAAASDLVIGL